MRSGCTLQGCPQGCVSQLGRQEVLLDTPTHKVLVSRPDDPQFTNHVVNLFSLALLFDATSNAVDSVETYRCCLRASEVVGSALLACRGRGAVVHDGAPFVRIPHAYGRGGDHQHLKTSKKRVRQRLCLLIRAVALPYLPK
jgi:hypothetical protein